MITDQLEALRAQLAVTQSTLEDAAHWLETYATAFAEAGEWAKASEAKARAMHLRRWRERVR